MAKKVSKRLKQLDREALKDGEYVYLDTETDEDQEPPVKRDIAVIFVKEYKAFVAKYGRKQKNHYLLSLNKIIKEKFPSTFTFPNRTQSFLLNYEIKKLLDKAINIKNQKYDTIIYLNENVSLTSILNTGKFLNKEYKHVIFNFEGLDLELSKSDEKRINEQFDQFDFTQNEKESD